MELLHLTKQQITYIYKERMPDDFIPEEIKPLWMIFWSIRRGIYECLGVFDGERLMGYAFLIRQGNSFLLDYLAIFDEFRNEGVGSETLSLLSEHVPGTANIIIEVENPDYAENDSDWELMTRRIGFYLRNGCFETGIKVTCFGVPFKLLLLGNHEWDDEQTIKERYERLYKLILPPFIHRRSIKIEK